MTALAPPSVVASSVDRPRVTWGQAGTLVVALVAFLWLADVQGLLGFWMQNRPLSQDEWLRAGVAYLGFAGVALWSWDWIARVVTDLKFWALVAVAAAAISAASWLGQQRRENQAAAPDLRAARERRLAMPMLRPSERAGLAVVSADGVHAGQASWVLPLSPDGQSLKEFLQDQETRQAPRDPQFDYQLPKGWTVQPASPMRVVNLRPADDPRAECYLTQLGGDGGGVLANVNRWRTGQMGLPAITEADIAKLPRTKLFGRDAVLVELDGTFSDTMNNKTQADARMLAAIVSLPMATISVKMVGPRDLITRERQGFEQFLASLGLPGQVRANPSDKPVTQPATGQTGATPKPNPGSTGAAGLRWLVPSEWSVGPARAMREATFVPKGASETECAVSILGGDGGGLLGNINRWRVDQFGATALTDADVAKLPKIAVLGKEGVVVDARGNYSGMGGVKRDGYALLGFICPLEGRVLFVKMVGPAAQVDAERERFLAFCKSLGKE